jgi:hypothetical protein
MAAVNARLAREPNGRRSFGLTQAAEQRSRRSSGEDPSNTPAADKVFAILAGTLLPGIRIADPMVTVRNGAYSASCHERQK